VKCLAMFAGTIVASCNANADPMEVRGPVPNGRLGEAADAASRRAKKAPLIECVRPADATTADADAAGRSR
jgi:hypothetical protein